jgi:hypothetical protein
VKAPPGGGAADLSVRTFTVDSLVVTAQPVPDGR